MQKIPKNFFGFLAVSFFIWLVINLSKVYETDISYHLNLVGLPNNRIFNEKPIENISLLIKATGFELLSANFSSKKIKLDISKPIYLAKDEYYVLPKKQIERVKKQLSQNLEIQKIVNDTIKLKLGTLRVKKVPIVADVLLEYKLGYSLSSSLRVSPDSVEISGSDSQLLKVNNVKTNKIEITNISEDFSKDVDLISPDSEGEIKMNIKTVKVSALVDKFTEGTLELPFVVNNLPKGLTINTFPKSVKVTYKVGLKKFNLIRPDLFTVECDYQVSKDNGLLYLLPKVTNSPREVSSIRLNPEKIDFLIIK